MLKGIYGILLFVFFVIVFILMLVGGKLVKGVKDFRKAAQRAADQEAQRRRYETGRQRQQYTHRAKPTQSQNAQAEEVTQEVRQDDFVRHSNAATDEPVTDQPQEKRDTRKIFDDSEGEYVDFEEA